MITIYDLLTIVVGTIGILAIFIIIYYKRAFCYWKNLNISYIEPSFPFGNFGSQFSKYLGQHVSDVHIKMKNNGAKFCGYYMFAMPVFLPITPEIIKHVLTKNFESFHDRGFHSDEKNDPMGCSLITTKGEKWKSMRSTLSPTFTIAKLKIMFPIIAACSHNLDHIFEEAARTSQPIDIYDISGRYTVDVICSSAFGLEGNSLKNPDSKFLKYGRRIFGLDFLSTMRFGLGAAAPALLKFFKIQLFDPTVTGFFHKVVHDTVKYRETNGIVRKDLIDLLIRIKNNENIDDDDKRKKNDDSKTVNLTVDEIAAHCFLFFLAGFETSSATIKFCLFELAQNLDIQEKVHEEIVSVLKKYNGDITYDALTELHYMDRVISETLRKHPMVHTLNRLSTEDFRIPQTNIIIKKGTRTAISILGMHNDPEFFPDPEKFDPERFTEEEKAKRLSYTYIPFGDGPRICPGMRFGLLETKIFLCRMLKGYKFLLHPKMKLPLVTCSSGPTLNTVDRILLLTEGR